jgi:hypothetical protein
VPRGGLRPGAGRPRGSKTVDLGGGGDELPAEHLLRVMRDPKADLLRRDRAAALLLPYFHARAEPIGKKVQADLDGQAAPVGTTWEDLLDPSPTRQ